MASDTPFNLKYSVRIVTAAALFDGHDVSINIMRRLMQRKGAEVIHLGHNRSVREIVKTTIEEDANGVAVTSYQGGHVRFFKYLREELDKAGCPHVKIFGGGGGVILPDEISELEQAGVEKIYSPEDGRRLGLVGMIEDLLSRCDFDITQAKIKKIHTRAFLARSITEIESNDKQSSKIVDSCPVIGFTGPGGAGKSTIVDEIVRRFLTYTKLNNIAVISVDPSKRKTGGALLGDRIRMNSIYDDRVFVRSIATRSANTATSTKLQSVVNFFKQQGYELIIIETSGIGQSNSEIVDIADQSIYVMTPEYGAASQLEKIDMLDFASVVALNKSDTLGSQDALRDVKKQFQRNHERFEEDTSEMPVYPTVASRFNDGGVNSLFVAIVKLLEFKLSSTVSNDIAAHEDAIIPKSRLNYLSEIADSLRKYNENVDALSEVAEQLYSLNNCQTMSELTESSVLELGRLFEKLKDLLPDDLFEKLTGWSGIVERYKKDTFEYQVRDKTFSIETKTTSLSGSLIPKVSIPSYKNWGGITKWLMQENFPGEFPFTAGVFPFKRQGEDPTRMFAGEGGPERTNRRFHYLCENSKAARLSTAFDSVTLYGQDPDSRPDIYGKIGNAGVSVCCLDDAKILYSGFDLCNPTTSVSMTINGPAAVITAFFINTAIDQQCEKYIIENGLVEKVREKIAKIHKALKLSIPRYRGELPKNHNGLGLLLLGVTGDQVLDKKVYEQIKVNTLEKIRGTVQADILKEDQAQNTCIFSTKFSLRLMADMQEYFIGNNIRNFYSVSISGYHIAEAGANPITQLAFTLANGFTYVEYYLSRGMKVDDFAPNFSFFFSNGIDPEYAVIGRVARRIWSKAMKNLYGANERSQKLKYHIQTSGRSLHAQEISFNDIRTTLQALYAIYDNCNSLHTNAYDEAVTTPTTESVRRALAIQLIINRELGLAKNENPLQGSFIIEELSSLVEEAVIAEFERISERGGVLGAMERMYQRSKIQEESMAYEKRKHDGTLPIVGVNTFIAPEDSIKQVPGDIFRSDDREKNSQVEKIEYQNRRYLAEIDSNLKSLQGVAHSRENIFNQLLETVKFCTLGQITKAFYDIGGSYRRNM